LQLGCATQVIGRGRPQKKCTALSCAQVIDINIRLTLDRRWP